MGRTPLAVLAALVLAGGPAASPARAAHVPLEARLARCSSGPERADRRAAFTASMPARPGASVLAVRFTLQRRTPAGWRRVVTPGFDRWERSLAGAPGFVFTKRVAGLWTPARFRAVVRFAWEDAAGEVVARARRRTRACRQPDRRPDLRPVAIDVRPAAGGGADYVVRLLNEGRGALEETATLALRAGGRLLGSATVERIAAGEGVDLRIAGPRCAPGEVLRATADPAHDVRERDEDDGVLEIACPA